MLHYYFVIFIMLIFTNHMKGLMCTELQHMQLLLRCVLNLEI